MSPPLHAESFAKLRAASLLVVSLRIASLLVVSLLAITLSSSGSATAATTDAPGYPDTALSYSDTAPSRAAEPLWAWPLEAPHSVVRPFVAPATRYSAGHRGIDIAARAGAIVHSPADGIIRFSGLVVDRNLLSIDHGGGLISSFEPVLSPLTEGTVVRRGEAIGALESGHCESSCLHFGVRLHGQYVSPLNYLGGITRSVLLPTRAVR